MAHFVNFTVEQNADFVAEVVLFDYNNDNFSLANVDSITAEVRRSYYTANAIASFTAEVQDAANGTFTLEMSSDITADLDPNTKYLFDVVATFDTGVKLRVLEGAVLVNGSVTKFA